MIVVLTGENSFEVDRELQRIITAFDGTAEKIDGESLELKHIPDLLMGSSLFAQKRLVIIKSLSNNKAVWAQLGEWLPRVSNDTQLVLVEPKPDKRTKTYKDLQKSAEVKDFKPWGERDTRLAESWAISEAKKMGMELTSTLARILVDRTGIDQWRIFYALEKLIVLPEVSKETIEDIIEASPTENVFQLFETALRGDGAKIHTVLETLELSTEPYQLFALLSGQAMQLVTLAVSDKQSGEVAKDIGAHPFVLSKLTPYARELSRSDAQRIIAAFDEADEAMKTSAIDPWVAIERALLKVAQLSQK